MGLFLIQSLQSNLFPYQQSINRMGSKLGVGSRMPEWAKKAAMSSFQPVPASGGKQKKKKKKDKDAHKDAHKKQGEKSGKNKAENPADAEKQADPAPELSEQAGSVEKTGGEGHGLSDRELRPADLKAAVAWSVILGEPAARKRRRRTGRKYVN